ncbi:MAG: hypothetical protein HRT90_03295 [Candidatus Margulisbacteria bacterium]|nr:hypothetical protein [Candidatus Margulisiibacteriota bacterium]
MMAKSVTLKRSVTIYAVVTNELKKFLKEDIQNSVSSNKKQLELSEKQYKGVLKTLKGPEAVSSRTALNSQFQHEKNKLELLIKDMQDKLHDVDKLKKDTLFNQGTVDGFVTIKDGDNLYEKLGAMEIIIKDGMVQTIEEKGYRIEK